jgi:hypothetical protein
MNWIISSWNWLTNFVTRIATAFGYFILAIVFFGGLGITIPFVIEIFKGHGHNIQDASQNFITYYIALFASAWLDLVLKILDKEDTNKKPKIVWLLVFVITFSIVTACFLIANNNGATGIFPWVLGSTIFSWIFWYLVHARDQAFNPANPLGGNTSKPLTNG